MPVDGAQIKLVDNRVRPGKPDLTHTVCVFKWIEGHMAVADCVALDGAGNAIKNEPEWIEPHWIAAPKPISKGQERQHDALLASEGSALFLYGPSPRRAEWLELPGLVLRWEKVTPVLHQLAEEGITTFTVSQLRRFVQRS